LASAIFPLPTSEPRGRRQSYAGLEGELAHGALTEGSRKRSGSRSVGHEKLPAPCERGHPALVSRFARRDLVALELQRRGRFRQEYARLTHA
jgi:hypothetical protein